MTFDPAINQETGASGRRYQGINLTGWIRCNCGAHKKQVGIKQLYVMLGGARGVMVIVTGYGHGDISSNPGPDWLHFT